MFAEARADCSDLLGDFNFLCDIIAGFLPLCSLARGAFTDIIKPNNVSLKLSYSYGATQ